MRARAPTARFECRHDETSALLLNAIQHCPAPEPKTQVRHRANHRGQAETAKHFYGDIGRIIEKLGDQNRGITDAAAGKHREQADQPERAPGAFFVTLGAELRLRSPAGERWLPVASFITGALETALAESEYIASALIPHVPSGAGSAFIEVSRRHGDFALAAAAAVVGLDESGRIHIVQAAVTGGTAPDAVRRSLALARTLIARA